VLDNERRQLTNVQVRGKKNLILEKDLAGPIGLFVNFSTLQDYGVDKVFFLENGNADTSQRNVVFVARGEMARHAQSIAGVYLLTKPSFHVYYHTWSFCTSAWALKVDCVDDYFHST
jgi:hypothetical protein